MLIAVALVTLVVFLFLGNLRATLAPSIAVIVSIVGTFGAMYMLGYSLNMLSLMALTIATGFVVDDAIVVVENIDRHIEAGMDNVEAALLGAREVGFTVLSITMSLIAVFTPILFMGGMIGRFFREFAMTLTVAILISLVISLTTTPMLCALVMRKQDPPEQDGARLSLFQKIFERLHTGYGRSLSLVAAPSASIIMLRAGRDHLVQLPSLWHDPQGPVSAAGHRPADGQAGGRPEHFLPGRQPEAGGNDPHRQGRPGGGNGGRLHRRGQRRRRRLDQYGARFSPRSSRCRSAMSASTR